MQVAACEAHCDDVDRHVGQLRDANAEQLNTFRQQLALRPDRDELDAAVASLNVDKDIVELRRGVNSWKAWQVTFSRGERMNHSKQLSGEPESVDPLPFRLI